MNSDLFRMLVINSLTRKSFEDIKDPKTKIDKEKYDNGTFILLEMYKESNSNVNSTFADQNDTVGELKTTNFKQKNFFNILQEVYQKAKSNHILYIMQEDTKKMISQKILEEEVKIPDNKQVEKLTEPPIILSTFKLLKAYLSADLSFFSTYQINQINYIKNVQNFFVLCHDILDKRNQLHGSKQKEIGYHEVLLY